VDASSSVKEKKTEVRIPLPFVNARGKNQGGESKKSTVEEGQSLYQGNIKIARKSVWQNMGTRAHRKEGMSGKRKSRPRRGHATKESPKVGNENVEHRNCESRGGSRKPLGKAK